MRKIKKNDLVEVISGASKAPAGQAPTRGKVLKVFPEKDRIIVEGVNMRKHHRKPTQDMPQGGIISVEAPIHVSNVLLVAPKSGVATRVGFKVLEDGSKVRVCKHPDANGEEVI